MRILGAMETPDGRWRVEALVEGKTRRFRILHDGDVRDCATIGVVEFWLQREGVDMGDLAPAETGITEPTQKAS